MDVNKLHGIHVFLRTNFFLYSLFFTYLIIEKKHVKHVIRMESQTKRMFTSFENMKKTCKLHVMESGVIQSLIKQVNNRGVIRRGCRPGGGDFIHIG